MGLKQLSITFIVAGAITATGACSQATEQNSDGNVGTPATTNGDDGKVIETAASSPTVAPERLGQPVDIDKGPPVGKVGTITVLSVKVNDKPSFVNPNDRPRVPDSVPEWKIRVGYTCNAKCGSVGWTPNGKWWWLQDSAGSQFVGTIPPGENQIDSSGYPQWVYDAEFSEAIQYGDDFKGLKTGQVYEGDLYFRAPVTKGMTLFAEGSIKYSSPPLASWKLS